MNEDDLKKAFQSLYSFGIRKIKKRGIMKNSFSLYKTSEAVLHCKQKDNPNCLCGLFLLPADEEIIKPEIYDVLCPDCLEKLEKMRHDLNEIFELLYLRF